VSVRFNIAVRGVSDAGVMGDIVSRAAGTEMSRRQQAQQAGQAPAGGPPAAAAAAGGSSSGSFSVPDAAPPGLDPSLLALLDSLRATHKFEIGAHLNLDKLIGDAPAGQADRLVASEAGAARGLLLLGDLGLEGGDMGEKPWRPPALGLGDLGFMGSRASRGC
jgi:hypothetical protein